MWMSLTVDDFAWHAMQLLHEARRVNCFFHSCPSTLARLRGKLSIKCDSLSTTLRDNIRNCLWTHIGKLVVWTSWRLPGTKPLLMYYRSRSGIRADRTHSLASGTNKWTERSKLSQYWSLERRAEDIAPLWIKQSTTNEKTFYNTRRYFVIGYRCLMNSFGENVHSMRDKQQQDCNA